MDLHYGRVLSACPKEWAGRAIIDEISIGYVDRVDTRVGLARPDSDVLLVEEFGSDRRITEGGSSLNRHVICPMNPVSRRSYNHIVLSTRCTGEEREANG
jgi:hypothetical protein